MPQDPEHAHPPDAAEPPGPALPPVPPVPLPYLQYSNRPPPPRDDSLMAFGHAIAGMAFYFSMLLAMKAAAARWRWDIGAICGVWVALLIFSFGLAGWLYGTFNWRGVMVGVFIAVLISLVAAPLVLG